MEGREPPTELPRPMEAFQAELVSLIRLTPRSGDVEPNGAQLEEEAKRRLNEKFGEGGLAAQVFYQRLLYA